MHIDGPDQVPMSLKATRFTDPSPIARLMSVSTGRTPAAGSSFGAGEARHVGLFAFVGEIVQVLAILPESHPLVMVPPVVVITDSMRIANKEGSYLFLDAKVNDLSCRLMTEITNTSFSAATLFVFGMLELFPPFGMFFAATLLVGKLTQVSVALPLQRTNAAPADHQGFPGGGGHRRQMNFSQIDGCANIAGRFFSLWNFHTHMQFKTVIPNKRASPVCFW